MGTNTGTIMMLSNSIIGVSVLAMPFCFKQCGIALSILMLIASSLLSRLACHFLLKSAVMARRRTFEFLAFHTFGFTGKFTVELFIIGFLMGTCIAFFVVMGDLGPAIVAKILGLPNTMSLRPSVLIGLAVFVVLPLGMLRNVDSLSSVSMATIGFYVCLVLKVVVESLPHLLAGDWYKHVNFWRPAGILQCIPIFSMALFCQTQLFEIYESMHNASLDRMNFVIRAACNICTGVYICVGFFGYVAFCTQPFTGNVLMSFTPSIVSEMIKLGFVLSLAVSFPLVIFPCRASLYSLLFRRITMPHHEGVGSHIPEARFKCLTVFIISVTLVIGLLIPNIELVLGLVGSTIGVLICVMFPAAAFICMSSKNSSDRLLAQALLFVGALILVLGTYATLNSVDETQPPPKNFINEPAPGMLQKTPNFQKVDNSFDVPPKLEPKSDNNVKIDEKPQVMADEVKAQSNEPKDTKEDLSKGGTRHEPPVPMEPAGQQQPTVAALINEPLKDGKKEKKQPMQEEDSEKKINYPKIEKQQMKLEGADQVHQDAIKKEEEELAEEEKKDNDASNKKNEEILRKLEKHEAQQMKILAEQKQILQALQQHQERELFKENAVKNSSLKQIIGIKEPVKVVLPGEHKVEQKKLVQPLIESEIQPPSQQEKGLLGQIDKNELKKAVEIAAPINVKSSNQTVKTIQTNKKSSDFKNKLEVPKIKESSIVAAPIVEVKPGRLGDPAPLLLERLKNPTLPLDINQTKKFIPSDVDNLKAVESEGGINAMRREILQESVVGTPDSLIKADKKNAFLMNPSIAPPKQEAKQELHDREKRDIEDFQNNNNDNEVFSNSNTGELHPFDHVTVQPTVKNCHITEKSDSVKPRHVEMYKEHDEIASQNVDVNTPVPLDTLNNVSEGSNLPSSPSQEMGLVGQNIKSFHSSASSSKVDGNEAPHSASDISVPHTVNSENKIDVMIKSSVHLSDPEVETGETKNVGILKSDMASPNAKPMKRDLKSISLPEEKSKRRS